jgi:hypothetical protein
MKRMFIVIIALVTLAVAAPNSQALTMHGPGAARHSAWAQAASVNVPLADANITIVEGRNLLPVYYADDHEVDLPQPGYGGWTYFSEHGLFLHELGHVFDFANLTPALRNRFRALAQTSCAWWAEHCHTARWISGPGVYVDVPPGEMFAEMYASCALGLTQGEYENAGYNSYGWMPPQGVNDADFCSLIREGATSPLRPASPAPDRGRTQLLHWNCRFGSGQWICPERHP